MAIQQLRKESSGLSVGFAAPPGRRTAMTDNHGSSQRRGWRPNRRQFLETAALAGLSLRFRTQASGAVGQGPATRDGAVYLTDLDRCRPASALSTQLRRGAETDDWEPCWWRWRRRRSRPHLRPEPQRLASDLRPIYRKALRTAQAGSGHGQACRGTPASHHPGLLRHPSGGKGTPAHPTRELRSLRDIYSSGKGADPERSGTCSFARPGCPGPSTDGWLTSSWSPCRRLR